MSAGFQLLAYSAALSKRYSLECKMRRSCSSMTVMSWIMLGRLARVLIAKVQWWHTCLQHQPILLQCRIGAKICPRHQALDRRYPVCRPKRLARTACLQCHLGVPDLFFNDVCRWETQKFQPILVVLYDRLSAADRLENTFSPQRSKTSLPVALGRDTPR